LRVAASQSVARSLPRETPARRAADASPRLARFEDVIALSREKRDLTLAYALERDVRPVAFEQGRIEFEPMPGAADDLAKTVARRLLEWTGERWLVAVSPSAGAQSVGERRDMNRRNAIEEAKSVPLVRAILERFPGAEILDVRDRVEIQEESDTLPAVTEGEGGEDEDPFEFLDTLQDDDF
jgi:DNA polymerase-3 subunit gamma/tau